MHEFDIIKKYFSKLSLNNKSSLDLNDDVFFDKSKELVISVDTYIEGTHFIDFRNPGLVIKTAAAEPASFNIYSGQSFSKRVADLMTKVVEVGSPLRNSEETYKTRSTDIEERLKKLEEREKLINSKYTEQFGKMEQSMTQFNSTKTLLENFIEAWKKQK